MLKITLDPVDPRPGRGMEIKTTVDVRAGNRTRGGSVCSVIPLPARLPPGGDNQALHNVLLSSVLIYRSRYMEPLLLDWMAGRENGVTDGTPFEVEFSVVDHVFDRFCGLHVRRPSPLIRQIYNEGLMVSLSGRMLGMTPEDGDPPRTLYIMDWEKADQPCYTIHHNDLADALKSTIKLREFANHLKDRTEVLNDPQD